MADAKKMGIIPIIILALTILLMLIANMQLPEFTAPNLLFIFNFVFLTISNIYVAIISAKSYVRHGALNILLLSCALAISGLVAFVGGLTWSVSVNIGMTIQDAGLLISAGLQVMSAIVTFTMTSSSETTKRGISLAASYLVTVACIIFLSAIVILNLTPPFYTDIGPTPLQQSFLWMTIFFLIMSSTLFLWQYYQSKSKPLYWYSLALILFATGETSFIFQSKSGDMFSWVGRIALYIGGLYFLMALSRNTIGPEKEEDISEQWSEAFSANPKQLSALTANMLDAFAYNRIITDKKGKPIDWIYLEVNKAFEETFGLKKQNVIGKRATQLFPNIASDPADWIGIYGRVALTGKPIMFDNFRQAQQRWYHVSAYCPKNGYFITFIEDITEQKQLQQKLETYAKNLEELVGERSKQLKDKERLAAIGETAGMIGHDIRNPLQAITNELYLAKEAMKQVPAEDTNEALESIKIVQEQTDYISKIVSDLQDYARPLKPDYAETKLSDLITSMLQTIVLPDNITLEIDIKGLPEIRTDPTFIRRALTNLTNNAIQSMPTGGKLTLSGFVKENNAVITVADTGKGIPDEIKPKIFTPLVTTKARGQGLGLAVVKRLVEALKGTITFESQEGKGTTFIITLPHTDNYSS